MFCKKCGTNNPPVARFCENCGIKLTADRYSGKKKTPDEEKDVPLSLVIAVIVVILVVAAIFAALSLI